MQDFQSRIDYYFLEGFFVDKPPEKYSCPICLSSVQREAFLTQCCGSHFCLQCISRMVTTAKPCPMCKASPLAVFPNKERQREINSLEVRCPTQLQLVNDPGAERISELESRTEAHTTTGNSSTSSEDDRAVNQITDSAVTCGTEAHATTGDSSTSSEDDRVVNQISAAVTCDWRGELGQLENHLQTNHRDDKRWKASSGGYDEPSPSQTQRGGGGSHRRVCVFHLNHGMRVMSMDRDGSHYHHYDHGSQPVAGVRMNVHSASGGRSVSSVGGGGGSHYHGHAQGSQPLQEGAVTRLQQSGERGNRNVSTISAHTDETSSGHTGTSQQHGESEHYLTSHQPLTAPLDDERHIMISGDLNQNQLSYDESASGPTARSSTSPDTPTPVQWSGGEVPTEPHLMPVWDFSSQQPPGRCRFHGPPLRPRMRHAGNGEGPRFRNPGGVGQAGHVHVIGPHPHHYRPHGPQPMLHQRPPPPMHHHHHHGPHHHGHRPHPHHGPRPHHHDSYPEHYEAQDHHHHRPHPHHGHRHHH